MKKAFIGGENCDGIICESWEGGGITDVAFKQRYDDGYRYAHSCQDTHDSDVFHYIFQSDDSDEPLGSCGMCGMWGSEFSHDPETMRDSCPMDIRLPPETRAFLMPAILSPEGRAAGWDLQITGTRATVATGARK